MEPSKYSVIGIKLKDEPGILISNLVQGLNPIPHVKIKILELAEKKVLVVQVFESVDKPVICANGACYIRLIGQKKPMPRHMLANYFISSHVKRMQKQRLEFEVNMMLEAVSPELNTTAEPNFNSYRIPQLLQSFSESVDLFDDETQSTLVHEIINTLGKFDHHKNLYLAEKDMLLHTTKRLGDGRLHEEVYNGRITEHRRGFNTVTLAEFHRSMKAMLTGLKKKF